MALNSSILTHRLIDTCCGLAPHLDFLRSPQFNRKTKLKIPNDDAQCGMVLAEFFITNSNV